MKKVILIGGGESGSLLITENGVRPIQPFDLAIRQTLKSANSMVNAVAAAQADSVRTKLAESATNLCNLAVQQVEEVVGPLDADHSLIFQDEQGGFTCGATGKPPIPLAWPPPTMGSLADLLAAGVVEQDVVVLLRRAQESQTKLIDVFEKPAEVAQALGVTLSDKSTRDLQSLAPSRLSGVSDEVEREILGFFHKVAEDGRYLETWFRRPYEVAQALKVNLSEPALERVTTSGAPSVGQGVVPRAVSPEIVAFGPVIAAGGIVALLGFTSSGSSFIKDRSGIEKL
jgi:hypothetical protein